MFWINRICTKLSNRFLNAAYSNLVSYFVFFFFCGRFIILHISYAEIKSRKKHSGESTIASHFLLVAAVSRFLCTSHQFFSSILIWFYFIWLIYFQSIHPIEKDLGFLRIGSLNVRVKKTTEAFSNFLGVGTNNNQGQYGSNVATGASHRMVQARNSVPHDLYDKLHKNWGSADNIPPSVSHSLICRIGTLCIRNELEENKRVLFFFAEECRPFDAATEI